MSQLRTQESTSTGQGTETEQTSTNCPECSGNVVADGVEHRCSDCGLITSIDDIDPGPEWYSGDTDSAEDSPSRCGRPVTHLRHDQGLTAEIGRFRDGYGSPLSHKKRKKFSKLRTEDLRAKLQNTERSHAYALGEIKRMGCALGLSDDIKQTAGMIFKQLHDDGFLIARSIESVATAALYTSLRMSDTARLPEKIYAVSRLNDDEQIFRDYRAICRELNVEVLPTDPRDYVSEIISDLGFYDSCVKSEFEQEVRSCLDAAIDANVHTTGVAPSSVAAAAIYTATLTTPVNFSQLGLASATPVSHITIQNIYPDIVQAAGISHEQPQNEPPWDPGMDEWLPDGFQTKPCDDSDCDITFLAEAQLDRHNVLKHDDS